jgi:hypothetical protein
VPVQCVDRRFDNRFRRRLIRIADRQENDVLASITPPGRLDVHSPSSGAPTRDAIDQG